MRLHKMPEVCCEVAEARRLVDEIWAISCDGCTEVPEGQLSGVGMSGTWVWHMSWGPQPEIVEAGMLSSINAEKVGQKL